jgi:gamma-glutamyltranspeptidase/glutathione hydrolase
LHIANRLWYRLKNANQLNWAETWHTLLTALNRTPRRMNTLLALCRSPVAWVLLLALLPVRTSSALAGTAAVAMPDQFSADVAESVLRSGGNAIDASIAAAFALAVTGPEAGNIGGGGFMISHMNGEDGFLDFRERAPAKASRDMYIDEGGNFKTAEALIGGKASGVPGTVSGLHAAHLRYGSKPWADLIKPAIDLANKGFIVHPSLAAAAKEILIETRGKTNFSQYFSTMKAGEVFVQAELADTLKRIAADPREFYTGLTARQIVAQMNATGGIIELSDLADYKAKWRSPLKRAWRDYTVVTAPPPSSGGIALMQLLGLRDELDKDFRSVWHNSPQYIHLLAEIEKRVFADRATYLGDPDFIDVPVEALLDHEYLARRATQVNPLSISLTPAVQAGLESSDTTHFSILDSAGNAVSITYTLNWDFGSGVVVEGSGFMMNNQMDDFSAKVGVKNKFGVIGSANNSIQPGKRMLSSMTPTILLNNGKPAMVIGTPGGSTIFTSVFQVLLNVYDYNMPLQAAIDANRFHHQLPDAKLIRHDQREIPNKTRSALTDMGYIVEANSWGDLGDVQAIKIDGGTVEVASDNRGRGEARLIKDLK